MKWKKLLSIILLAGGIALCSLAGFDITVYELAGDWRKALVVFSSWGFVGIGLTLVGLGIFIQTKLETA